MRDFEKTRMLTTIARLYYEHNYSQQMIADKLKLSRPYVSKLINEARERKIVEIKINDPYTVETQLEGEIRERFNLQRAIVVPKAANNDNIGERIANAAARFLDSIIRDGDIIGVGWGSTMYECSQRIISRSDLKNITVVQICGGISKIEKNIYAAEIPKNISEAYRGIPYILPLPAVVDSKALKDAILTDKNIKNIFEIAEKSNIIMSTVGAFGYNEALARAGYINENEVTGLLSRGAVGDICTRIIDINGKVCDAELDQRTISIELDKLREKEYRIGITFGINKLKCTYGALKGGYFNVLITDEDIAASIIKLCEEQI